MIEPIDGLIGVMRIKEPKNRSSDIDDLYSYHQGDGKELQVLNAGLNFHRTI